MDYTFKSSTKRLTLGLVALGVLSIVYAVLTHVPGQRIWANLLVNSYFFVGIGLMGTLWMAIQYASEAGWSAGFKRVPEAVSQFLFIGGPILLLTLIAGSHNLHWHHIYHWMDPQLMDPTSSHYDSIIAGKAAYLNEPFFYLRAVAYIGIWIAFTMYFRKASLKEDLEGGVSIHKKNYGFAAAFLVFYGITSSTAAWDWMMSIDTHWFSTLFGWYNFATFFVTGITFFALIVISLKRNGYLPDVNQEHLQDLGKFMFGASVFWGYLWFSQFMLIWYANIPEEVTYFQDRWKNYKVVWGALPILNLFLPMLLLMDKAAKRNFNMMTITGVIIVVGHWLDVFQMVMPGSVKTDWGLGVLEIGMFLGFLGLFLFVVHSSLAKAPLVAKNHPYLDEAKHHHV
ncbi:MAG: quinol:cytochrome C oxidoreductase [Bacteroidetes bacterium]|nr:MAG: quinol:cytochrome C oxidoreductase [Bacteroidota bacterium]